MKDKEKQFKEMANDWDYVAHMLRFNDCYMLSLKQWSEPAREMVKLGWIKPTKDSVMLSKEEFDKLKYAWITDSEVYKKASKETAEKFAKGLIKIIREKDTYLDWDDVLEFAKEQFGVEIKE